MRPALLVSFSALFSICLADFTTAAERSPDSYRDAATLLAEAGGAESSAIADPRHHPLDAPTLAFLEKCAPATELLLAAAQDPPKMPDVAEIDVTIDETTMRHLSDARRLGGLMILQSRRHAREGRFDAAADHLLAALALARHVGGERLLVARMVETGIEQLTIEHLAETMSAWPDETLARFGARYAALPAPASNASTILAECRFAQSQVRRQAGGQGILPRAAAVATTQVSDPVQLVDELQPFYFALADAADASPDAFAAVLDEQLALAGDNVFASILAPSLKAFRGPQAAMEVKRAMLPVAIDVLLHGAAAAKRSRDPFGEGAFRYRDDRIRFTLESDIVVRDAPLTLHVRKRN